MKTTTQSEIGTLIFSWLTRSNLKSTDVAIAYVQNVMISYATGLRRLTWPDESIIMSLITAMVAPKSVKLGKLIETADTALIVRSLFSRALRKTNSLNAIVDAGITAYSSAATTVSDSAWHSVFDELSKKFTVITAAIEQGWENSISSHEIEMQKKCLIRL